MTVTPYRPRTVNGVRRTQKKKTCATHFGQNYYVVPVSKLSDLILTFREQLTQEYTSPSDHHEHHTSARSGWRLLLAERMAKTLNIKTETVERRLNDIIHKKTSTTKAAFADAACLAVGLRLELDTDLPVLPGNTRDALDLVTIRAEMQGVTLTEDEAQRLARITHRVSALISKYPHKIDRLLDLAPYDCLRPAR